MSYFPPELNPSKTCRTQLFVAMFGHQKRDGLQRGLAAAAGGFNPAEELHPLEAAGATTWLRCLFVGDKIFRHFLIGASLSRPPLYSRPLQLQRPRWISLHLRSLSHWLLASLVCTRSAKPRSLAAFLSFPLFLAGAQRAETPGKTRKTLVSA